MYFKRIEPSPVKDRIDFIDFGVLQQRAKDESLPFSQYLLTEWSGKASGCFIYPFIMYLLNIRTLGGQQINNQIKLNFFFIFDLFSYKLSLSTKEIHIFYFFYFAYCIQRNIRSNFIFDLFVSLSEGECKTGRISMFKLYLYLNTMSWRIQQGTIRLKMQKGENLTKRK